VGAFDARVLFVSLSTIAEGADLRVVGWVLTVYDAAGAAALAVINATILFLGNRLFLR
jgi:hypothetical protein